eukprot:TRINITY_DN17962_c0_g1_i1.p1 TRINITY_DN17962_c0_g1~~TRINITY_DN17962_c0_g1_i1.p1  ORF type:complete len:290 (-),score=26.18 TRINITY_DN17962_c0_g1_i1:223-1092(-)
MLPLALFFFLIVLGAEAIRLTETQLPSHAIRGEDVILQCSYDMEGDKLYSVKWYRNGKEFYRHIPSDNPPTAVFRQPGLFVDEYKSTETRIVLRKVEIVTAGYYQCEVSGEAPLFQTAKSMNNLKIVDLPDDGPIISGSQPRYNTKDILAANCTSSNSVPAANLNWYINGEEATNAMLIPYQVKENRRGLYSSTLGLRLEIKDKLFSKTGDLKIKCTATIDTIYWRSNEESIQGIHEKSFSNLANSGFWNSAAHPIYSSSPTLFLSLHQSSLLWIAVLTVTSSSIVTLL